MKKVAALIISLCFLAGCSAPAVSSAVSEASSAPASASPKSEAVSTPAVETDKGLFDVKITLSAAMVSAITADGTSIEDAIMNSPETEGIKEVITNEDGSATIVMTKSAHKKLLDSVMKSIEEAVADITSEENSIAEITYNKDLTEFVVKVDQAAYEKSLDGFNLLALYLTASFYQSFNGVASPSVTFELVNDATGETFSTVVYPDAFENQ